MLCKFVRFPHSSAVVLGLALLAGCMVQDAGWAATPKVALNGPSSVRLGSTAQYVATVANAASQVVTWQVNGVAGGNAVAGVISKSGLYTPPDRIASPGTVKITAVSAALSSATASLTVTLYNPVPAISSATLQGTGTTKAYAVDVKGSGFVAGAAVLINGTKLATTLLSSTELAATYTAAAAEQSGTVQVTVVNPAPGSATSAALTATLNYPAPVVKVNGPTSIRIGGSAQYRATVSNTLNTTVSWSVNGVAGGNSVYGTISQSGLYTSPTALPSPATVTISAVSAVAASSVGTQSVAILNPVPVATEATAVATSSTHFTLDIRGLGFVRGATILVGSSALPTTYISPTEVQGDYAAQDSSASSVSVAIMNPSPGASTSSAITATFWVISPTAAARLLDQTSFGPTLDSISHVATVGMASYLKEQFNAPPTLLADLPSPYPTPCQNTSYPCAESEWWSVALNGPDQLRARVALALSEILVTSTAMVKGEAMTAYMNTLSKDAFSNYRTILQDVTLSPTMGTYLNMLNSNKPSATQIANENYARELLQLFSVGLYQLNADGSQHLDAGGHPIPVYTEAQIEGLAQAFTGWTFANADGSAPTKFPNNTYAWDDPMQPLESHHDTRSKTILSGVVLSAGQSAEQDLKTALDTVFNHPNVAPFICRQLIQHLVTSTPSAGYVERIAAVFNNNGNGVRGDMKSVLSAILLDEEARAGDQIADYDIGHLREPILYMTAVLRALNYVSTDASPDANYAYRSLSNYTANLSERPLHSGNVFNFFPIAYILPGTAINAPEFGIENTATTIGRLSLANYLANNQISGFTADLSASSWLGQLAATNPELLVDALSGLFLHGQMPSAMRSSILTQISSIPAKNPSLRAKVAVYLTISSSEFKVIH